MRTFGQVCRLPMILATVVGTATLSKEFPVPDAALFGKKALFYVPANDRQYDVVYVRVGNDATFENSCGAKNWKRVDDPRLPPELQNANDSA